MQEAAKIVVEETHKNNALMAIMRTLNNLILGMGSFIDSFGTSRFTVQSLPQLSSGVAHTFDLMANFKELSEGFLVGFHDETHLDDLSIQSLISSMMPQHIDTQLLSKSIYTDDVDIC